MTEAATRGRIIRARRYVSAPAGSYPAPVPPRPRPEEPETADTPPVGESAASPAPPGAGKPAAPAVPRETPVLPAEIPAAAGTPASRESAAGSRPGWGGVLLGTLVGGVVGATLGLVLVAFFGGCEPSLAWTDPLAVWHTVGDPVIRFSGILVAAGCTLLGAALGGRRPALPADD